MKARLDPRIVATRTHFRWRSAQGGGPGANHALIAWLLVDAGHRRSLSRERGAFRRQLTAAMRNDEGGPYVVRGTIPTGALEIPEVIRRAGSSLTIARCKKPNAAKSPRRWIAALLVEPATFRMFRCSRQGPKAAVHSLVIP